MRALRWLAMGIFVCFVDQPSQADIRDAVSDITIQDLHLTVPSGWTVQQDARNNATIILGFANGQDYLSLFVKQETGLDMHNLFANGSNIVQDVTQERHGAHEWSVLQTRKSGSNGAGTIYVSSFLIEFQGHSYYGYAKANSQTKAHDIVNVFLEGVQ